MKSAPQSSRPNSKQQTSTDSDREGIKCHHCNSTRFVKRKKTANGYRVYLCKECSRHFTVNPNKFVPCVDLEAEYKKDIWDCRNLGVENRPGRYHYKLKFIDISQPWLREAAKQFLRYSISTLAFATAVARLSTLKHFSEFLDESHPNIKPLEIDRSVISGFLGFLLRKKYSASFRCSTIGNLKTFLELCVQNRWLEVQRYLVRSEDYPQRPKSQPRYIPEEVLEQLNQHLDELPEPVKRMIIVLQECGMRASELLFLQYDCLLQDKQGDWFLKYYQYKMKKEITIPISRELARVIQEQQRYIRINIPLEYNYLFCSSEGGPGGNKFKPSPKPMGYQAFWKYLNTLTDEHNICDLSGKRWHFQLHQFRHTVGTRMINNGVPQHVIMRYLGHESPQMTAVYAHIHDQTMKAEVAKFQSKVVNIAGQVVESVKPEVDVSDLQWFKRNVQAQALPNGSCALPTIAQSCPHANACLTCSHFRTTAEFLEDHKKQLKQTEKLIEKAKANDWVRQVEMNEKIAANLRSIIKGLEEQANG